MESNKNKKENNILKQPQENVTENRMQNDTKSVNNPTKNKDKSDTSTKKFIIDSPNPDDFDEGDYEDVENPPQ